MSKTRQKFDFGMEPSVTILHPTCFSIIAMHLVFYTPDLSGRIMVWRLRLSVCLSVCPSVCLSTKLVDTTQTEPFQLGPSDLVHILLMTREQTLLIFKVRGQRSRSHARHIVVKPCKHNTD